MTDWADEKILELDANEIDIFIDEPTRKILAQALRAARNDALEEAAKCASMFVINQPRLHPDVSWEKTNEVSKHAAHVSAQLIAEAIRALKEPNP